MSPGKKLFKLLLVHHIIENWFGTFDWQTYLGDLLCIWGCFCLKYKGVFLSIILCNCQICRIILWSSKVSHFLWSLIQSVHHASVTAKAAWYKIFQLVSYGIDGWYTHLYLGVGLCEVYTNDIPVIQVRGHGWFVHFIFRFQG